MTALYVLDSPSDRADTGPYLAPEGVSPPSTLSLPALPSAAPAARRHVLRALRAWGLDTICETAELLVSELMTNAIKASQGTSARSWPAHAHADPQRIIVGIARTGTGAVIRVWDASTTPPAVSDSGPMDEGGRGLLLVNVLSHCWGYYLADRGGKVVWCDVDAP